MDKKNKKKSDNATENEKFPLPVYDQKDDIYNQAKEVQLSDEDQKPVAKTGANDKSLDEGLDLPGTELDDANEAIGEEDEENNYYSLGGENHEGLEEDKA